MSHYRCFDTSVTNPRGYWGEKNRNEEKEKQSKTKQKTLSWWFPCLFQIIKYNFESNLKLFTIIIKVLQKVGPHHLSNQKTTFTCCSLTCWLTVSSISKLFLKKLSKGDFFLLQWKDKTYKVDFSSPSLTIPLKFTEIWIQYFFLRKTQLTVHKHSIKFLNDSGLHSL